MLIEPGLDGAAFVLGLTETADGDKDHVIAEFSADLSGELEAVDAGKAEVDESEIGMLIEHEAQSFQTIARIDDMVAEPAELEPH